MLSEPLNLGNEIALLWERAFRDMWREAEAIMCGPIISDADREKIEKKSIKLLLGWLNPEQRKQYKTAGWFDVTGSAGGNYRVTNGAEYFNVWELSPDGVVLRELCFVPRQTKGVGDIMLSQKIYLEIDEKAMLDVANYRLPHARESVVWASPGSGGRIDEAATEAVAT